MSSKVQIIGGAFQDPEGNLLSNGHLVLTLSQDAQVNSNTEVGAGLNIIINLGSDGNVSTSPAQYVWPNDILSPSNTFYMASAYSEDGQLVWGPNAVQIFSSPSPYNIGAWVPGSVNVSSGSNNGVLLETNGVRNGSQSTLNLVNGTNVSITNDGSGNTTISSTGGIASIGVIAANGISGTSSGGINPRLTLTLNSITAPTTIANLTTGISGTDINLGATTNPDPTSAGNVLYWAVPGDVIHFGRPTNFPNSTGLYKNNSISQFLINDDALPVTSTSTGLSVGGLILNSVTSTTATAGTATLPAAPLGFVEIYVGSTLVKIPYYAV